MNTVLKIKFYKMQNNIILSEINATIDSEICRIVNENKNCNDGLEYFISCKLNLLKAFINKLEYTDLPTERYLLLMMRELRDFCEDDHENYRRKYENFIEYESDIYSYGDLIYFWVMTDILNIYIEYGYDISKVELSLFDFYCCVSDFSCSEIDEKDLKCYEIPVYNSRIKKRKRGLYSTIFSKHALRILIIIITVGLSLMLLVHAINEDDKSYESKIKFGIEFMLLNMAAFYVGSTKDI